jgi:hypothetical protein
MTTFSLIMEFVKQENQGVSINMVNVFHAHLLLREIKIPLVLLKVVLSIRWMDVLDVIYPIYGI